MQDDENTPTLARGILRVSTLLGILAVGGFFIWDMFSETTALNRLAVTARNYHYTESCDTEGNLVSSATANCVDLNHYVFVYGPVMKAIRRACTGKPATMLLFEKGKVARIEINRVEKMLRFRARNGTSTPC